MARRSCTFKSLRSAVAHSAFGGGGDQWCVHILTFSSNPQVWASPRYTCRSWYWKYYRNNTCRNNTRIPVHKNNPWYRDAASLLEFQLSASSILNFLWTRQCEMKTFIMWLLVLISNQIYVPDIQFGYCARLAALIGELGYGRSSRSFPGERFYSFEVRWTRIDPQDPNFRRAEIFRGNYNSTHFKNRGILIFP
jgi:hypothetical protein